MPGPVGANTFNREEAFGAAQCWGRGQLQAHCISISAALPESWSVTPTSWAVERMKGLVHACTVLTRAPGMELVLSTHWLSSQFFLSHTLLYHTWLHTKHLLSVSLLNPTLWNDRKGPLTPCPEVPWSLYLGLLGDFALWTYLREFPPWLLCPQWNNSLVIQPTQMTRVRVCWHEELLAGCAPRRSCGGSSCFAGDKGSQGLPHLPA